MAESNDALPNNRRYIFTAAILLIAVLAVTYKYYDYLANPWTRNGQVNAEIIQIAPRVTGPIVSLPIKDNQFVRAGELLFEVDDLVYRADLDQATAELDQALDNYKALIEQVNANVAQVNVAKHAITQAQANIDGTNSTIERNKSEYERQQELLPQKATSQKAVESAKANYDVSLDKKTSAISGMHQAQASLLVSQANLQQAKANLGSEGESNAKIRAAKAKLKQAQLNMEFTQVRAPTDGYVTNLNLRVGGQAIANQPLLALVDTNSYSVNGYFKETLVGQMCEGNESVVTLLSYPDKRIKGHIESIGWGISQQDGSTGFELLPNVNPTFEWIRLAQRVPVKIKLIDVPSDVALRVGTTASVLVYANQCESAAAVRD